MHNPHHDTHHSEAYLKRQVDELKAELEKSEAANIKLYKAFIDASEEIEANLNYQNVKGFRNETEINLRDAKRIAEEAEIKVAEVKVELSETQAQNNVLYNELQAYKKESKLKFDTMVAQYLEKLKSAKQQEDIKLEQAEKKIQLMKVFLIACKKYDGQTLNGTSLAATAAEILLKAE